MRRSMLLVFALVALVSVAALAQEPTSSPEEQAMMAKWMEFSTPAEPHKVLAHRAGSWTVKITSWMMPDAPPLTSEGTSEVKAIFDGRYYEDTSISDFQGMPFQGRGLAGYDNMKKKYFWTWIDNMGTGVMLAEGDYDPAKKTFTFMTEAPDVMAGEYKPMKVIETWKSVDEWKSEMHSTTPAGKGWWKSMEVVYTRKK